MSRDHTTVTATRRAATSFLLVLLLAGAALGCAVNPATGRREITTMSPEREAAVGQEAAAQVAQEIGLVEDPALASYVSALGQRVAATAPRPDVAFQFQVVDMPEPNAFALPGGYVYVSRGLLAIANSEEELGNVIGHEIAHVAARHAAQRETAQLGAGALAILGAIAGAVLGLPGELVGALPQVAAAGLIASYGRDQEREADRLGQQYAAAAGLDPEAMATFLRTLERQTRLEAGSTRRPSFFDTHPATPERVEDTAARAGELAWRREPPLAPTREAFLAKLEGLELGEDAAEGAFRGDAFLHPGLGFRMRFPDGWKGQNGRTAVGAIAPEGDAIVVLELQGRGDDPKRAAAAFLQRQPVRVVDHGAFRGAGGDGYRAVAVADSQQGTLALHLAWLVHRGLVYRVTGVSPPQAFRAREAAFVAVTKSFRPITAEEASSVRQKRLRLVPARAGETLAQLGARSGNAWSVEETAVANGLDSDGRLAGGFLVKIAVEEPLAARSVAPGPGAAR